MDNFTFHNPTKMIFGKGRIKEIGKEIGNNNINKVLLLAGGGSIKTNGVYEQVTNSLKENNIEWLESWGVRPNPSLEHANKVSELISANKLEAILAVGGGSVIDEAKSVAAGIYVDNIWDIFEGNAQIEKALPIFTVLTLSATGSEMNSFAVLSNDKEMKKWSFGSPHVYPKVTILDPSVQNSLPWRQTANGGVDSLSHLMEYYFMGLDAEVTFGINESLQRTVIQEIDKLMVNQNNYNARANYTWSSTLALNGISGVAMGGGEWTVHGIEHSLSVMNPEIAHGEGLAVIFPAWIKYVWEVKPEIFRKWAKNVWEADSVEDAIQKMKDKFTSWNAPITLRELGFTKSDFSRIIEITFNYGRVGKIKNLKKEDMFNILDLAY
ncbi:MAG: butanol dehydrogenase [Ignavibacteria bacterium GWF2_33_9]|nr:MAG: butanol dehydrogenase [Ignavibacteria bacterium GWF2_33_9]